MLEQIDAAAILCEDVYIEFNNNFETISEMAEEYCIDEVLLRMIINTGRTYNNLTADISSTAPIEVLYEIHKLP